MKLKASTVGQLHKLLGKLVDQGHARLPICISKTTFTHNCESDGCTIMPLSGCNVEFIRQADGDGGTKINKDGTESIRKTAVLYGCSGADEADR